MLFKKTIISTLISPLLIGSSALIFSGVTYANDSTELEELRALVQELDQKVKVLDRKTEIASEDAAISKKEAPTVSASEKGFGIKSADGAFQLNFHGQIQTDGRDYINNSGSSSGNSNATNIKTTDTFLLKQFRPIIQGVIYDKYDFLFVPDFGNGKIIVLDAFVNAKFAPSFQVEIGKQKTPFGLERLQADVDSKFITPGLTNNLVPNRDIGLQLHGLVANNTTDYALGVFDGVIDGNGTDYYTNSDTDNNSAKEFVARVFTKPFKNTPGLLQGLGFGLATTYTNFTGSGLGVNAATAQSPSQSNLPSFRSSLGQLTFFNYRTAAAGSNATGGTFADGKQLRISPQLYYYAGPFGLFGEYVQENQSVSKINAGTKRSSTLSNNAWQIVASWMLTGEDASFNNPTPKQSFDLTNGTGLGAWELVARFAELNVDNQAFSPFGTGTAVVQQANSYADPRASVRQASAWAAGINWYLNKNLKVALDYEQTSFDGGWTNTAGTDFENRPTEKVLSTRLQLAF